MRIFYHPITFEQSMHCVLPEDESKHICKVLRMQNGESIALVNGKGTEAIAMIIENHPKKCLIEIQSVKEFNKENFHIHIALAPTKNMDRTEWLVEKMTELGVHEISFILTSQSERKNIKLERLEKIAVSAMKQSKRYFLPTLNPLISLRDFFELHSPCGIAHCSELTKKQNISKLTKEQIKNLPIIIGPEGDFTSEEINMMQKNENLFLHLGNTRLRTETAALYACAILKSKLEE
ncbi:MAG: 16S rRNA (uracil(1498)-N(3))-methyltransferase [Crocinitomicaceae bacterium]|nr:16S rRNA (uracil(1498)-N(3))-methyltransferase [Crocinitomicaceae bacterium]